MSWKHPLAAVLAVSIIVLVPFAFLAKPDPVQAGPVQNERGLVSCSPQGEAVVCSLIDGTVVLRVPIPTVRVPGPTIRVPGPTVEVPGPQRPTVTEPAPPRATETVTERPQPRETVTVRPDNTEPSEGPTATVTESSEAAPDTPQPTETETVTESPSGQPSPSRVTVTPSPDVETVTETLTETETVVRNVVVGALAALLLAGLGILALWIGYVLGYKGAERQEARSLRNMIDGIRYRGNHS